ncbi:MAG: LLM class flavin-dependent oxidoreductase [Tepidiformaceae bacterium]
MKKSLVCIASRIADGVALARDAEDAGFEAIWATEFHNRDVYTWMTAMGLATDRIAIGSGIAYAFARPPVLVAAAAADVDEVTGGRAILGLGSGTQRMNESWYGLPFEKPAARMREAVEIIRETWAAAGGPRFRHEGTHWNLDIENFRRPGLVRERVPIYVAGVNRLMSRVAGEVADGYIGHPLFSRRYMREVAHPAVEEGLRRSGRTRDGFEMANYVICSVHPDRAVARREAAQQIAFHATVYTYRVVFELHGFAAEREAIRDAFTRLDLQRMTELVPEEMIDQCAVAGTPGECREQLSAYEGLVDNAMFFAPSFGIPGKRVMECQRAILATFGT